MAAPQRFLVTGGAGFVGGALVRALRDRGHFVRIVDDLSRTGGSRGGPGRDAASGPAEPPEGCEWIRGSIDDPVLCREACEGMDGVFHFAAAIETPSGVEPVEHFMRANAEGTRNVLLAARDGHVRKVVYAGSRTVYGGHAPPCVTSLPPDCLTPYALSKLMGEQLCALFTRLYGLPTLSLRFADVYGPGQPTTGPYATAVGTLLAGRRAGRLLDPTGDGVQERDLLHVDDAVDAAVRAFEVSASGMTLNVGSGRTYATKSLADCIAGGGTKSAEAGPACGSLGRDRREAIEETRRRLGWAPRVSIEAGLRALIGADAPPPAAGAARPRAGRARSAGRRGADPGESSGDPRGAARAPRPEVRRRSRSGH